MQTHLQDLLNKEMSRKEFLATLGFGVASVFGLGAILKMSGVTSSQQHASKGYGSSLYGGK